MKIRAYTITKDGHLVGTEGCAKCEIMIAGQTQVTVINSLLLANEYAAKGYTVAPITIKVGRLSSYYKSLMAFADDCSDELKTDMKSFMSAVAKIHD